MPDRRAFILGAGTATAALALGAPSGVARAVASAVAAWPTPPAAFDPAAFVNDMLDAGCRVTLIRSVPIGRGDPIRPARVVIAPADMRGFGTAYDVVMERWSAVLRACPDHPERLTAYAVGQLERDAS